MLKSWIDGEEAHLISIQDRGLLYGDGFFTTVAIKDAKPCLWDFHLSRIAHSCEKLVLNISLEKLQSDLFRFINEAPQQERLVLKIIVTRGEGQRGYGMPKDSLPRVIFQLFEFEQVDELVRKRSKGLNVTFCNNKLSRVGHFSGIKHLNRLENVFIASEPHLINFDEALVFDYDDYLVEGLSSNIFLLKDDMLLTPLLDKAGVEGVVKAWLKSRLQINEMRFSESRISKDDVFQADGIFMTNAILGVCKVNRIDQSSWQPNEPKVEAFLARIDWPDSKVSF